MVDYDAIVVGGGISGLLSTLALSKEGKKVLLLEKDSYLGGVCRSYNVDGYTVDTGPHIITRLEHGPLKALMDKYFEFTPVFIPHGKYYVRLGGRVLPFPWNLSAWLTFDLLPPLDRVYLMRTLFSVSYLFSSDPNLQKMSVGQLIGEGVSPETKHFLNCMCAFMTGGTSMYDTPVSRFIDSEHYKTLSDQNLVDKLYSILMKEGATDQTYPKKGIQSITDSIIASLPKEKVTIKTLEEVKVIEAGKKKTVATEKDNYTTDLVVYSGLSRDLPDVIKNLPKDYSEKLRKIKNIRSLSLWLGLKKRVFEFQGSEIWADGEPYSWVVPTSNYDPELAPKGKQLVGFGFILPKDARPEDYKKKALDRIYKIMPQMEKQVEMTHYQYLVPEKAVWTVTTEFADVKTPVDGLYLVGTDTTKKSMGVTRASYSVNQLLEELRKDKKI
ncbi:MAG: NAD(P)/FAD-dependent oxidoreductase [Candidatus Altiarchaeota archaeon]|nr:NAD(P)/FAD-dependent oxidoreductase [Candidatus Altiarchaeota archaeon]